MDLNEAAANEFEGADLDALRSYCDRLGVEYHPNMNASTLRKKLTAALGEYRETHGDETEGLNVASQQTAIKKLVSYNLKSTGAWEGKRRMIRLHRSMSHDNTSRPQFFAWGRLHVYVPFGQDVAIPYPIWNILKDTTGKRMDRKRRVDEDGRIRFEEVWAPTERFMYSDMGDDPVTADRPEDEIQRIRMLHDLTDGFKGYGERQFRAMCNALHIRTVEGWSPTDHKNAVLMRIGMSDTHVDLSTPEEAVA